MHLMCTPCATPSARLFELKPGQPMSPAALLARAPPPPPPAPAPTPEPPSAEQLLAFGAGGEPEADGSVAAGEGDPAAEPAEAGSDHPTAATTAEAEL